MMKETKNMKIQLFNQKENLLLEWNLNIKMKEKNTININLKMFHQGLENIMTIIIIISISL
mgnify:CR=1 FL=1